MNDLKMLRDLGAELDPAQPEPAPEIRQRVMAFTSDPGRRPSPSPVTSPSARLVGAVRVRRPALVALPIAAALVVGVVTASAVLQSGSSPTRPPSVQLGARQILLAAATTARSEVVTPPPADSFVYTRTREVGLSFAFREGAPETSTPFTSIRESWFSVDGSQEGAVTPSGSTQLSVVPGCVDGESKTENGAREACQPDPAYLGDFPTTESGAYQKLFTTPTGAHNDAYSAFEQGGDFLIERMMPAESRAALLEAIAEIPAVTEQPGPVRVNGVTGVAVSYERNGIRDDLVFDTTTHRIIGRRSVVTTPEGGSPVGTVLYAAGVVEQGVVDELLERPDGSMRAPDYERVPIKKMPPS